MNEQPDDKDLREKIRILQLELRQTINAHARNESMSLNERKENADVAVEHFLDQILALIPLVKLRRLTPKEIQGVIKSDKKRKYNVAVTVTPRDIVIAQAQLELDQAQINPSIPKER